MVARRITVDHGVVIRRMALRDVANRCAGGIMDGRSNANIRFDELRGLLTRLGFVEKYHLE